MSKTTLSTAKPELERGINPETGLEFSPSDFEGKSTLEIAQMLGIDPESQEFKQLLKIVEDPETMEGMLNFAKGIALEVGFDWDEMETEDQGFFAANVMETYSLYANDYISRIPDKDIQKRIKLILDTGINQQLIDKSPEVVKWMELMQEHYIMYLKESMREAEEEMEAEIENVQKLNNDINIDNKDIKNNLID